MNFFSILSQKARFELTIELLVIAARFPENITLKVMESIVTRSLIISECSRTLYIRSHKRRRRGIVVLIKAMAFHFPGLCAAYHSTVNVLQPMHMGVTTLLFYALINTVHLYYFFLFFFRNIFQTFEGGQAVLLSSKQQKIINVEKVEVEILAKTRMQQYSSRRITSIQQFSSCYYKHILLLRNSLLSRLTAAGAGLSQSHGDIIVSSGIPINIMLVTYMSSLSSLIIIS